MNMPAATMVRATEGARYEEPIFRTTHAALSYAFSAGFGCYPRSVMARMGSPPTRASARPGGIDGAAQAGLIVSIIDGVASDTDGAILAARYTKRTTVCECGRLCCCGHKQAAAWLEAVLLLTEGLRFAVPETSSNRQLREICVRKYFGERINMVEAAAQCKVHRITSSAHNNKIVTLLKVDEKRAMYVVGAALEEAGIVGA